MFNTLSQFDEKLLLKLTLGQQLQQPLTVPDVLTDYVATDIETTQDLLQTNQYWMLLQQAGQQPQQASSKILDQLEKNTQIVVEDVMSEALSDVVTWILNQDRPHQYSTWIRQILNIVKAQELVIPRRFVLKIAGLERNAWLLASTLPQIAFHGGVVSSRLEEAKIFYQYVKHQNAEPLLKYLSKQTRSDWLYLMAIVCGSCPQLIQEKPTEFWKNAIETGHTASYLEAVLSSNLPPLTQLKPVYDYLLTLELKNAESIKKKGGLFLYLFYQNEQIYPEFVQLMKACVSFDSKTKKLILNVNLEQNEKFEQLGVITSSESRSLKDALASNLVDKTYDSFIKGEQGLIYLGKLLEYLPLRAWQEVFSDWSELLRLSSHQQVHVYYAFILRCYFEERQDLAIWFYQQQAIWLERSVIAQPKFEHRLYALLNSDEAQQLLQQRLALHLKNLDADKFWFVLEHSPQIWKQSWVTEPAIEMILAIKQHLTTNDTEKREQLKARAEWLILNTLAIDFERISDLFSRAEWQHLSSIVREKQQLQTAV